MRLAGECVRCKEMREPRLALQFGVGAQGGWQSCTLSQGPLDLSGVASKQGLAWRFHGKLASFWQWEEQHRGRSCEDFQNWKRTNDPEYQAQGLAMYLQENGIGKVPSHLSLRRMTLFPGAEEQPQP